METKNKKFINSVFAKDTTENGNLILIDILWDEFKTQVESGICSDGRVHDPLINKQGYVNIIIERKKEKFKRITHNTYNNDHKPNDK